ncbi:MAG TPA: hypothetical protein VK116_00450, partial [Planctomycetota bacterium]|nr:hypothetical protein [Planctomycetota bacterium]
MRRRTTFLLAALALGLTLWAIFIEAQHHAIWEGAGKLFPTLEPSDIVALEVKIAEPGGTERQIRLEREGEYDWNLRHPIDFPAFLPRV